MPSLPWLQSNSSQPSDFRVFGHPTPLGNPVSQSPIHSAFPEYVCQVPVGCVRQTPSETSWSRKGLLQMGRMFLWLLGLKRGLQDHDSQGWDSAASRPSRFLSHLWSCLTPAFKWERWLLRQPQAHSIQLCSPAGRTSSSQHPYIDPRGRVVGPAWVACPRLA